jgi:hypothetical protein
MHTVVLYLQTRILFLHLFIHHIRCNLVFWLSVLYIALNVKKPALDSADVVSDFVRRAESITTDCQYNMSLSAHSLLRVISSFIAVSVWVSV